MEMEVLRTRTLGLTAVLPETGFGSFGTNMGISLRVLSRPTLLSSMKENARKRTTRVGVYSALAGGAVGFALGMLFAPKRGPDARRRIAYQLEHLVDQTEDVLRRLLQSSARSEARRNSDAVVEDAETRADHIRDDIDALLEELRQSSQSSDGSD